MIGSISDFSELELSISSSFLDVVEKMSQVCPDPPETLDPALVTYNGSPVGDSTRTFFISAATAAHQQSLAAKRT